MVKKSSTKKQAYNYLRVSSEAQVQTDYDPDGLSIAAQREAGQDKAVQLDAQIVQEYSDPGRSAYLDLHKRTGFLKMLEDLKRCNQNSATRVDYVIVWSLSRWARNTVDHWQTRAAVHETGARLISISEPMAGEDTAAGFLYEGMVVTYNQYNSMLTGEAVSRGLRQKARSGGTYGWAPIGYVNASDELPDGKRVASIAIDPKRGKFITLTFQLYRSGEYSISLLAAELHRLGLRTRSTRRHPNGNRISTTTVQRILRDPYYAGWIVYKRDTPDEQTFQGRHEPLIDQDTFDRVQLMLDERRQTGNRSQHVDHYLRGSILCGECGHRLAFAISRSKTGKQYPYFFCMARINGRKCSMRRNIRPELIEDAVARYYRKRPIELTPTDVVERADAIQALAAVSREAVHRVKAAKTALIDKLKAEQVRLLRLHIEEGDDVSPDAFRDERARLQTEIEAAEQSLAETEQRLVLDADELRMALELASDIAEVYETADNQIKRSYNLAFFKRIFVLPNTEDGTTGTEIRVSRAVLTEPYAVLLADDLAADVLAEAEQITASATDTGLALLGSTTGEDDPEGSSSALSSYFVKMAEGTGFEPAVGLHPLRFSRLLALRSDSALERQRRLEGTVEGTGSGRNPGYSLDAVRPRWGAPSTDGSGGHAARH